MIKTEPFISHRIPLEDTLKAVKLMKDKSEFFYKILIKTRNDKEGIHMENVLYARVDDRLIHGQVMTAWMKLLPAKEIIVIDNKVAKDEFMINST